ncbi:hypothetical protein NLU13_9069 [Sarocladium strictum]|uniref:HpcH/HpaI aldolase/citrate lyase domain-containing protein n=1 Tax=Sarocladium strictum TaxID=5046 RepID=A0AA39G9X7_SARSR|nr:hypothetical protein NLU13_9069 [Sarocladium strictum]
MENLSRVKVALREGRQTFGLWQMIPGANVSRCLARAGADWVCVDCEHGNMDDAAMHDAVPAIVAAGVSPLVRIAGMESWMVKRALDCGAHGIVVPLIRSAEEARALVQAAKFPPWGRRGFGSPYSPASFGISSTEYLQQANHSLLTIVQIETKEALETVDEIAAVEGIDALFIGPVDLGNNIGFPILGGVVMPELKDAIARIFAATRRARKKCGIFAVSGEQAKIFAGQGFDMISVAADFPVLEMAMQSQMGVARSGVSRETPGLYRFPSGTPGMR